MEQAERLASASNLNKKYVIASMGAGLIPLPMVDLVALTGVQLKMLHSLAKLLDSDLIAKIEEIDRELWPKQYKFRRLMLHDISKSVTMAFEVSDEKEEIKQQSAKIARRSKASKKI